MNFNGLQERRLAGSSGQSLFTGTTMKSIIFIALACAALSPALACAQTAERVRDATMSSSMLFAYEDSAPSMVRPTIHIGAGSDPVSIAIEYAHDKGELQGVEAVRWSGRDFGRLSTLQASLVITGPTGRIWRSNAATLSANLNGPGIITNGYEGLALNEGASALFAEFQSGGEFVFVLEDQDGQRWGPTRSTLPSPDQRQRLFEAYQERLRNQPPVITPTPRQVGGK